MTFQINEIQLAHLQARASALALAERDPERQDRRTDDAHDLLNEVLSLLGENGLALIEDPAEVDTAFAKSHLGMLQQVAR